MAFYGNNACHSWAKFSGSGNVSSTVEGHNVSSAADNGEADYTINFTTSFSNTDYCQVAGSDNGSSQVRCNCRHTQNTGSYRFKTMTTADSGGANDASNGMIAFFGK